MSFFVDSLMRALTREVDNVQDRIDFLLNPNKCPACQQPVGRRDQFCLMCGKKLR